VRALARVLQVLTGDSWASGVARSIFQPGKTDAGIAFFFVSYILIASVSGSLRVYLYASLYPLYASLYPLYTAHVIPAGLPPASLPSPPGTPIAHLPRVLLEHIRALG